MEKYDIQLRFGEGLWVYLRSDILEVFGHAYTEELKRMRIKDGRLTMARIFSCLPKDAQKMSLCVLIIDLS